MTSLKYLEQSNVKETFQQITLVGGASLLLISSVFLFGKTTQKVKPQAILLKNLPIN